MKQFFILGLIACFSCTYAKAQTQDGDSLYNLPIIHEVYFQVPYSNFFDSLIIHHNADVYTMCSMTLDNIVFDSVGIKFKGNSSYNNPGQKKSIKVDMDLYVPGQDFDDIKKFNLNNGFKDPTLIREKIMLDYLNEVGVPAPRCGYAKVYLNNQYWGLYTLVEEVNKKFLGQRFAENDSNLFKGDPHGDLRWLGNSTPSTYYPHYELDANDSLSNDWRDLVHLINKINNTPPNVFVDSLETVFNTDNFIPQWAATNLFVNLDSYIGSGHNYYLYHNALTNKFEFISWDVNEAFGTFRMTFTTNQIKNYSLFAFGANGSRPLIQKMVENPVYKQRLADSTCEMLNHHFIYSKLSNKIDSLANAIRAAVYSDTKKSYSNQQFEDNLTMDITTSGPGGTFAILGLKPFIQSRITWVQQELAPYGCVITSNDIALNHSLKIYPNPTQEVLHIENLALNFPKGCTLTLLNAQGQNVWEIQADNDISIDTKDFVEGVYILQLQDEEHSIYTKIVVY